MIDPVELISNPEHGLVTESRPLQVTLSKFLADALTKSSPAFAEAGTGIGKSFAYLTHAMARAAARPSGDTRQILISTALKSLQQQLLYKDLPRLSKYYPHVRFARRLGKKNYGCRRLVHQDMLGPLDMRTYERFFDTVQDWVWEDAPDDLTLPADHTRYSVAHCSKSRCDFFEQCSERGYVGAMDNASKAQVLVVNHALVAADLRVARQHGTYIFDSVDTVIFDEAHKYIEVLRDTLSVEMHKRHFDRAAKRYQEVSVGVSLAYRGSTVPAHLPASSELQGAYIDMHYEAQREGALGEKAQHFAELAKKTAVDVRRQYLALTEQEKQRWPTAVTESLQHIESYVDRLEEMRAAITYVPVEGQPLRQVMDYADDTIRVIPLDVARPYQEYVKARALRPLYLSATLTTRPNDFSHIARDFGYKSDEILLKSVGSPFDMQKQAYAYVPMRVHTPPPASANYASWQGYYDAQMEALLPLLLANEGHAFILFTSNAHMLEIEKRLTAAKYPYPLLVQNKFKTSQGRDLFLNTKNATLLGVKSFWEGIDIPGLQLTLVCIMKLPFPTPTDPVIAAKSRPPSNYNFVGVPRALIDFKQQVGRLIRTQDDKGILAVFDPRFMDPRSPNTPLFHAALGGMVIERREARVVQSLTTLSQLRRKAL